MKHVYTCYTCTFLGITQAQLQKCFITSFVLPYTFIKYITFSLFDVEQSGIKGGCMIFRGLQPYFVAQVVQAVKVNNMQNDSLCSSHSVSLFYLKCNIQLFKN